MTLLGMELHATNGPVDDCRGEVGTVWAGGEAIAGGLANDSKRADEVETAIRRQIARERMIGFLPLYGVPAHMRNPQSLGVGKSPRMSADQAETGHVTFLAGKRQHLHADADAQHRPARGGEFQHGAAKTGLLESAHAGVEGSDAGDDQALGLRHGLRAGDDVRRNPQLAEHIAYGAQIADAIVDYAYLGIRLGAAMGHKCIARATSGQPTILRQTWERW